jgi:uncharacterized protein YegL
MNEIAGQEVLLFYIVCDESGSMGPNGGIEEINRALPELHATLAADPLVVDKSRLSIIAFSDAAETILPMTRVIDVADMPGVQESGLTNYGTAFDLLTASIESDVNSMKSQGYRVYRPCVFFMSDGEPTDDWEPAYQRLKAHQYRPHIVAFGVDGADPGILAKVATLKCYVGRDRSKAGRALANVMSSIGNTIVSSVSNAQNGPAQIDLPPQIDGFDTVPLDTL